MELHIVCVGLVYGILKWIYFNLSHESSRTSRCNRLYSSSSSILAKQLIQYELVIIQEMQFFFPFIQTLIMFSSIAKLYVYNPPRTHSLTMIGTTKDQPGTCPPLTMALCYTSPLSLRRVKLNHHFYCINQ